MNKTAKKATQSTKTPEKRDILPPSRSLTLAEFIAEGERLFGPDRMTWRWRCPICKHVATTAEYQAAGAPEAAVGFNCIGRYTGAKRTMYDAGQPGPCNYTGGGLFHLNPVRISDHPGYAFFEFAPYEKGEARPETLSIEKEPNDRHAE